MSIEASQIINAVKSENLLADSSLLSQIEELRSSLQYKSDGQLFSYDDYFLLLQQQIEGISRINLKTEVSPGTASQYQIQLITAFEDVLDDCERVLIKLLSLQSKLLVAQERLETLKASFTAWYALAAQQYLSSYDIDLSKVVIADLAKAEYERLIGGLDVEVNSLIAAVAVQIKTVNKRKQTAEQKFNLGKDQANAAWTGHLLSGNMGTNSDAGSRELLHESEEEVEDSVPAFVSKQPKMGATTCVHFNEPLDCQQCRNEIRGVFTKQGDPKPVQIIGEVGDGQNNDND